MGKQRSRPKRPGEKLLQAYVPAEVMNRFKAATNIEDRSITEVVTEFMKSYAERVLSQPQPRK